MHGDISWEVQRFNSGNGHEGPYSGYPRPDLEKAWEDLLGRTYGPPDEWSKQELTSYSFWQQ